MRVRRGRQWVAGLLAAPLLVGLLFVNGPGTAQEKEPAATGAAKKERAKPRGRLPAYYGSVVSPDQREKIYAIQAKYSKQLEDLESQLAALKDQRDSEVEAVLTPEQLEKVIAQREAAAAKRKKRAEANKKPDNE